MPQPDRVQRVGRANLGANLREGATTAAAERILTLNAEAARLWLIRVIADRAVQLFRERRGQADARASFTDGGSNGQGSKLKRKRRNGS